VARPKYSAITEYGEVRASGALIGTSRCQSVGDAGRDDLGWDPPYARHPPRVTAPHRELSDGIWAGKASEKQRGRYVR
jgi:hypothetical protein